MLYSVVYMAYAAIACREEIHEAIMDAKMKITIQLWSRLCGNKFMNFPI